jgi:2-keto-4-pentenoate hydratase/2-oxohepta-3-ene-1,7-dioic acid hydratase in catechol pathway
MVKSLVAGASFLVAGLGLVVPPAPSVAVPAAPGDVVTIEIEGIGTLRTPMAAPQ